MFPYVPGCHCKELAVFNILVLQTLEVKEKEKKIPKSHVGAKRRHWTKPTRTPWHCVPSSIAELLADFHVPIGLVGRGRQLQLGFQAVSADFEDKTTPQPSQKYICDLLPLLSLGDKA